MKQTLEAALVCLVLLYWTASFVVLLFRLVWPDFQRLAAYGGHSAAASGETKAAAATNARARAATCAKGKAKAKALCDAVMVVVQTSPLGSVRVTRKQAFTAFYVTGLVTSAFLLLAQITEHSRAAAPSHLHSVQLATAVPPLLFAIHCAVRLSETRYVQRFRLHDTVTLFAAVAGSTFYAAAAVSSAVPAATASAHASPWLAHSTYLQLIFATGAAAHLTVQAVQVMVHTILAKLRCSTENAISSEAASTAALEEGVWRYVQAALSASATPVTLQATVNAGGPSPWHRLWQTYPFPYRCNFVFQLVLDPHYSCEVLLYSMNTALIALCVLPHPMLHVEQETEVRLWGYRCPSVAWLSVLASAAVTLFTLINLSITSAEHRRFWKTSNASRRETAQVLRVLLSSDEREGARRLPPDLVGTATRMLEMCAAEEELPRWNLVPLVW